MSYYLYKDTELYYKVIGEGKPFLLIHGWGIDHRFLEKCMEPVFDEVSGDYRRIYVDLPGMGLSKAGTVKNGDGMIEVLDSLMQFLAAGEAYYIAGNSFGTVVARALAARCTDRVLGLLLIAPALDYKIEGVENGIFEKDDDFLNSLTEADRRVFSQMNARLTEDTWKRFDEYVMPSININKDNDLANRRLRGSFSFDINKKLCKNHFDKPMLILTAKYDLAVGYKEQRKWLELFPGARYELIDGAGHNIHIDQPEAFHICVRDFIEQL